MKRMVMGAAVLCALGGAVVIADDAASQPAASQPATTGPAATQAAVPAEVTEKINKAIGLLEAGGKSREVFELLATPADLEEVKKQEGGIEKVMADFDSKGMAKDLLQTLKLAKAGVPTKVTETEVHFAGKEDVRDADFVKVEGHWYLE